MKSSLAQDSELFATRELRNGTVDELCLPSQVVARKSSEQRII